MNAAFQSHLTFPLAHFASAVGLSPEAVRRAGELGELVIDYDGQVDLWERENWSYLMRAVNKRNSGGNNNMKESTQNKDNQFSTDNQYSKENQFEKDNQFTDKSKMSGGEKK